jgi:hypothetical protein
MLESTRSSESKPFGQIKVAKKDYNGWVRESGEAQAPNRTGKSQAPR